MAKKKKEKQSVDPTLATNKKARRDYDIISSLEAGLVLLGTEVKSVRAGGLNLKDSYVREKGGELYMVNCHISPYSHGPVDAHAPLRERKLLLHKKEIEKLSMSIQAKGLTLIPLKMYLKNGRCKVELGLGKGKKDFDKREDVKRREANRDIEREISRRR
jgi:SsrA-binding protein